jgi:hypothetical protein
MEISPLAAADSLGSLNGYHDGCRRQSTGPLLRGRVDRVSNGLDEDRFRRGRLADSKPVGSIAASEAEEINNAHRPMPLRRRGL